MTTKNLYGVNPIAALRIMDSSEFRWRKCRNVPGLYHIRSAIAAKAASIVAHDRVLCGELPARGVPSYFGIGSDDQ